MSISKLLIGVLYLAWLVYMIYFMSQFVSIFLNFGNTGANTFISNPQSFITLVILNMLFSFTLIGIIIYLIVNVYHNEKIEADKRIMWVIILIIGSVITLPYYWLKYLK